MSVEALVAAAMVSLVKPDTEGGRQRLATMAATFVEEARPVALWPGDDGLLATTLMLVAIGYHESTFHEKTRRCLPRPGAYLGLFQILPGPNTRPHTIAEVCASDALQARLALRVIKRARDRCPRCTPAFLVRAYASGDGGIKSKEARDITNLWTRSSAFVNLRVFPFSREAPQKIAQR